MLNTTARAAPFYTLMGLLLKRTQLLTLPHYGTILETIPLKSEEWNSYRRTALPKEPCMRQISRLIALGYIGIVAVIAALQLLGVTSFAAPVNVIPRPARPPVVVNLVYSSEQQEWIAAAA